MSVPNCPGCEEELRAVEEFEEFGYHFAGSGLYEKGHLKMYMVNDEGEWVAG